MKVWKYIKQGETISLGELFKRYYGESGSYYSCEVFLTCVVENCSKLTVIPFTSSTPYMITRKKTFFEKVLDKFNKV